MKFTIEYPNGKKQKSAFCREYGLNSIYAGKHWAKRKADKDYWTILVRSAVFKANKTPEIYEEPVELVFSWDDGLDCSNHAYMSKMIEDVLTGIVIKGDSRKWVKRVVHEFNDNGVITVEIRRFNNEVQNADQ